MRRAAAADAPSIAQVHVESWKTTYRGILPDEYLDQLSVEQREQFWTSTLAASDSNSTTIVAIDEASSRVVGFACAGKERTGELGCDEELYAIYLLREAQRQKLGTLLLKELAAIGFSVVAVWVLNANPARKFYEATGGRVLKEQSIELAGKAFAETAYRIDLSLHTPF